MKVDVIVIGGGPGGLSAALILGRCRRSAIVFDQGEARNLHTRRVNGFLGLSGSSPTELRRLARNQISAHSSIQFSSQEVQSAQLRGGSFEVKTAEGSTYRGRRLLLATGLRDNAPSQPGVKEHYGRGVYTCPYCDGWENRDKPLAVYGKAEEGFGFALELSIWSDQITLCTDGWKDYPHSLRQELLGHGIALREEPIKALHGDGERLEKIEFLQGQDLGVVAMFLATGQQQRCELGASLGCKVNSKGLLESTAHGETNVAGLFVVGDSDGKLEMAIAAAADGARAAYQINQTFFREKMGASLEMAHASFLPR